MHVDVVEPLPTSRSFTHLFTVIDRFTRWTGAIPVSDTIPVLSSWIARFGTHITPDRGAQFTWTLWRQLSTLIGSEIHTTRAYHPQANDLVKTFHRSLKNALRTRLNGETWTYQLPWVLLGLRTIPKVDIGSFDADLSTGVRWHLSSTCWFVVPTKDTPGNVEFLRNLRANVPALGPIPPSRHGKKTVQVPTSLRTANYVFVRHNSLRNPLTSLRLALPGYRTQKQNLRIGRRRQWWWHRYHRSTSLMW